LKFEPPSLRCAGDKCGNKPIKRGAVYYSTPASDARIIFCQKCYGALDSQTVIQSAPSLESVQKGESVKTKQPYRKNMLTKLIFDDEVAEPWVQCDECETWVHQVCALFNCKMEGSGAQDEKFTCPVCLLQRKSRKGVDRTPNAAVVRKVTKETKRQEPAKSTNSPKQTTSLYLPRSQEKIQSSNKEECDRIAHSFLKEHFSEIQSEFACGSLILPPSPSSSMSSSTEASRKMYSARGLPQTGLSSFLEAQVCKKLREMKEFDAAERTIIRVVSSVDSEMEIPESLLKNFYYGPKETSSFKGNMDQAFGWRTGKMKPVGYRSKVILMFQELDGMEVLLFCMYAQEYGMECPVFSQRRVYISYLDSVGYFRPRRARTAVYHQLLISYMEHARRRGFDWVHIWSCPPVRGNNFILWCHPPHQRNPGKERLTSWYHEMLAKAQQQGTIVCVHSLFTLSFNRWFVPPPNSGTNKAIHKHDQSKSKGKMKATNGKKFKGSLTSPNAVQQGQGATAISVAPPSALFSSSSQEMLGSPPPVVVVDPMTSPQSLNQCRVKYNNSGAMLFHSRILPPFFDGDYWPSETERLFRVQEARIKRQIMKLTKDNKILPPAIGQAKSSVANGKAEFSDKSTANAVKNPVVGACDGIENTDKREGGAHTSASSSCGARSTVHVAGITQHGKMGEELSYIPQPAALFQPRVQSASQVALMSSASSSRPFHGSSSPGIQKSCAVSLLNDGLNTNHVGGRSSGHATSNGSNKAPSFNAPESGLVSGTKSKKRQLSLVENVSKSVHNLARDMLTVQLNHVCIKCGQVIRNGKVWESRGIMGGNVEMAKISDLCEKCCVMHKHSLETEHGYCEFIERTIDVVPELPVDGDATFSGETHDYRHIFLRHCEFNRLQFDTLRRAKYSTMMILFNLHQYLQS